ncbi:ROK family transcriptional regulator [Paenibacillus sp. Marseille-Q4541]|uniref:ROK family protein n=1 Tax=Paenibacillus sp. Marseille-Q4541 TaxID=2831522 RepID=UPI001BA513DB|nr:ROK family transcriptional regulator [Paenibacillus sp. Marseille-Q4541]
MNKHDQDFLKQQNRLTVFQIIKKEQPVSRASIAKRTGMSATTISRIISEFIEERLVQETEEQTSTGRGRKSTLVRLRDHAILSIGVELDQSQVLVGIVDVLGHIVCRCCFSRTTEDDADATMTSISVHINELIEQHGIDRTRIVGIGVGLPGIIDIDSGTVQFSVQLGWKNVNLTTRLEELTGFKTVVDNELKLKALAEQRNGSAYGSERTVLLGFGNGVGSALILQGEIYRGATNSAGEIGHTTMDPDGMICDCGKAGCLQTYITIPSLLAEASKAHPVRNIEELFKARAEGKRWACYLIDRALAYMAITINNVATTYNPDSIILSGEFLDKFPEVYEEIIDLCYTRYIWEPIRDSFTIVTSELHEDGVLIGSGLAAQDRFFILH